LVTIIFLREQQGSLKRKVTLVKPTGALFFQLDHFSYIFFYNRYIKKENSWSYWFWQIANSSEKNYLSNYGLNYE